VDRKTLDDVTSLSVDAVTLVQSFISCHLDYCNSLLSGITVCSGASTRCRTRRQSDSSPALVDVTTLLQC